MYQHHIDSIERLKEYYRDWEGVIAIVLDGSVVKGNARPDSDIDAIVVVTEEKFAELKMENRMTEVIGGCCTYEGGYFDIKYKTKALLREAKIRCFQANLALNQNYFLNCVPESNAYMRAHLAQEIVYSVYRLILAENRVLFPCNRRLEDAVASCPHRPADILQLGAKFLQDVNPETCAAFVSAFTAQTRLHMEQNLNRLLSDYTLYYEDWWREENPPFPNEW